MQRNRLVLVMKFAILERCAKYIDAGYGEERSKGLFLFFCFLKALSYITIIFNKVYFQTSLESSIFG